MINNNETITFASAIFKLDAALIQSEAFTRWNTSPPVAMRDVALDEEHPLFAQYILRHYLACSLDPETKNQVDHSLTEMRPKGMHTQHDGLLYLSQIKRYIHPQTRKFRLRTNLKISQLTVVECGGYKKYLTKVQSYCNLIGRLAVTDDILRTTVLAQLKLIPNVRKIRDKVEEINDLD